MEYDEIRGDFKLDQQDRNLLGTKVERLPISSIGDLADKADSLAREASQRLLTIDDTASDAGVAKYIAKLQLNYAHCLFRVIAKADVELSDTELNRLSGQN